MVECQLPKLNTRVRFPSSAPKKAVPSARMGAAFFVKGPGSETVGYTVLFLPQKIAGNVRLLWIAFCNTI